MATRLEVKTVDNRDPSTTWLWVSPSEYVEVDPFDLVENMIENLPEDEQQRARDAFRALKESM